MKYIKVNNDLRIYGCKDYYYFIKNELITFKRFKNICKAHNINYCQLLRNRKIFSLFEISQNKTYWFFGCRFAVSESEKDIRL